MLFKTLTFLATLVVIGTLLSVIQHQAWWVRAWDFPRTQILVFGSVLLACYFAVGPQGWPDKAVFALLSVSLILQAWRIFPYTPWASEQSLIEEQPRPESSISILVSNVFMDNDDSRPLLQLVEAKQPDIFLAAETNQRWADELSVLKRSHPYSVEVPLENTYGMLLYSKLEIVEPQIDYLMDPEIPSIRCKVILRSGAQTRLYLLHPKPPYPAESMKTTERDAEILIVGRSIRDSPLPAIVAGDLNDVAWSHTTRLFQRVSGMLDPRIGRGLYSTFHAQIPILRWPLDHVFHTDEFKLAGLQRLQDIGSDHFPIFVTLSLDTVMAPIEQDAPEPNPGDLEEAAEKIEAGREEGDSPGGPPVDPGKK